jgi:hypothetical protein
MDVHGTGPNDVFAVGQLGTVLHFDGDRWTPVRVQSPSQISRVLAVGREVFLVQDEPTPPGRMTPVVHLRRLVPW